MVARSCEFESHPAHQQKRLSDSTDSLFLISGGYGMCPFAVWHQPLCDMVSAAIWYGYHHGNCIKIVMEQCKKKEHHCMTTRAASSPMHCIVIRFVPNRPRTRRAPRYVHGLAGPPQGVRVPRMICNFDAIALRHHCYAV